MPALASGAPASLPFGMIRVRTTGKITAHWELNERQAQRLCLRRLSRLPVTHSSSPTNAVHSGAVLKRARLRRKRE